MYFIGIDGGGTKTICILTDAKLQILKRLSGPASNPLSKGFAESSEIITSLIRKITAENFTKESIYVVAGIAGCGGKKNADKLTRLIKQNLSPIKIPVKKVKVVSDAEIALEGSLNGKPGAVLISGTGSVLIGKNPDGQLVKIGGFGKLVGDEGSGYSIGKKGLQAVSKYFDGRGPHTTLADSLEKKFGIRDRESFILIVHSNGFDIACAATEVLSAAHKKDRVCVNIIDNEIKEILLHLKSLNTSIKGNVIPVCFAGSLLTNKNYFSTGLKNQIAKRFKAIKLSSSKHPPEFGAVILANKLFNQN